MIRQVIASFDPALSAHVVSCTPLYYSDGPDPALDQPAYVRAGSSLARIGKHLVVIQDDSDFVALIEPDSRHTRAVPLPAGAEGKRQFDDLRGNKRFKSDLEACVTIPYDSDELLLAFGSGASPTRERIAVISGWLSGPLRAEFCDGRELYAALRAAQDFAGSDMNIEGAVFVEGKIRLFGRGNGAPSGRLLPLDATCDLEWTALYAYLQHPNTSPPPLPSAITQYQLGTINGLRLSFTDATIGHDTVVFSAAAEQSPDAVSDGAVAGSAIGVFDTPENLRLTVLLDRRGGLFAGKVEGLLLDLETPYRAFVVVDQDDPFRPSELCEVELSGPWYAR